MLGKIPYNFNRNIFCIKAFGMHGETNGADSLEWTNHYHRTAIVCM